MKTNLISYQLFFREFTHRGGHRQVSQGQPAHATIPLPLLRQAVFFRRVSRDAPTTRGGTPGAPDKFVSSHYLLSNGL